MVPLGISAAQKWVEEAQRSVYGSQWQHPSNSVEDEEAPRGSLKPFDVIDTNHDGIIQNDELWHAVNDSQSTIDLGQLMTQYPQIKTNLAAELAHWVGNPLRTGSSQPHLNGSTDSNPFSAV